MCVIVSDPEDGYMNYELEMKQMFHKVAPFISINYALLIDICRF